MKNRILLFITILLICIFPTYVLAEEEIKTYTNLNISSVITTSVDMNEISKFNVKYRVYTSPENFKEEEIVLIKSDGYSTKKLYQSMTNASFVSAYAVASDGTIDKYGFVTFKPNVTYDDENSTITIELLVSFNDMGFDGKNFRKNSDVTDEYIEERKNGVALKDSQVVGKTTNPATTIPTTTGISGYVINETTTKKVKTEKQDDNNSVKALEYIVIFALILLGLVGIFVLIKFNASKKRV